MGGFTALGAGREEIVALAGAGVSAAVAEKASVFGAYLGEFGDATSHNVTPGFRLGF